METRWTLRCVFQRKVASLLGRHRQKRLFRGKWRNISHFAWSLWIIMDRHSSDEPSNVQRDATCSSLLIFFIINSTIFLPPEMLNPVLTWHISFGMSFFFYIFTRHWRAWMCRLCQTAWSNILIYRYFCGMCSAPVRMPSGRYRMPSDVTSSPRPDHDVGAEVEGAQNWGSMRWHSGIVNTKGFCLVVFLHQIAQIVP